MVVKKFTDYTPVQVAIKNELSKIPAKYEATMYEIAETAYNLGFGNGIKNGLEAIFDQQKEYDR